MLAAILETVPTEVLVVADDVTLRDIGPGDVRVKIAHSGVCHSDLSAMNGTIPQEPPAVLGHEGAGVVVDVGDEVAHVVTYEGRWGGKAIVGRWSIDQSGVTQQSIQQTVYPGNSILDVQACPNMRAHRSTHRWGDPGRGTRTQRQHRGRQTPIL